MSAKPIIYVIDDDVAVQDSLRALLESADLEVRAFGNGPDFLAAIENGRQGCVVLDVDLPVMTGLEVLDHLAGRRADLPVILITGRADRETRQRSKDSPALALLEKPMSEDMLLGTISKVLESTTRLHSTE